MSVCTAVMVTVDFRVAQTVSGAGGGGHGLPQSLALSVTGRQPSGSRKDPTERLYSPYRPGQAKKLVPPR